MLWSHRSFPAHDLWLVNDVSLGRRGVVVSKPEMLLMIAIPLIF